MDRARTTAAFLAAGFLGTLPLSAAPTNPPPIEITGEVGFANYVPPERPFPFVIELGGAVRPIEGHLRVVAPNHVGGETSYARAFSITPRARKRYEFTLPPFAGHSPRVQIVERNGTLLREEQFFGIPIERGSPLIVIVQNNASSRFLLPRPSGEIAKGGWRVVSMDPQTLPEKRLSLAGVSAILWRADKENALTEAQSAALLDWLEQGGVFVAAGGRCAPPNLPRRFRGECRWGDTVPCDLREFAGLKLDVPRRPLTIATRVQPTDGERAVFPAVTIGLRPLVGNDVPCRLHLNGTKLVTEQPVGGGVWVQLAFDPHDLALQEAGLDRAFWERLLALPGPSANGWHALGWLAGIARDGNHMALAQAADYRVKSVWKIAWMFGVFFGLAFCLNFLLFRKSRRYEFAWLILILASVSVFLYNRAFGRVGGFAPTRQFEITESYGVAGQRAVLNFTETGLLAPVSREHTVATASPETMFLSLDREDRAVLVDESRQLYPVRLKAGAFTTCSSVGFDELPGEGITMLWSRTDSHLRVRVTNKTGLALKSAGFMPPTLGMRFTEEGNSYVLSVRLHEFDNWVRQIVRLPLAQPFCYPRGASPALALLYVSGEMFDGPAARGCSPTGYFGSLPQSAPLELGLPSFRFELPETTKPITASGAREVRCRRTVTLYLPVPVSVNE